MFCTLDRVQNILGSISNYERHVRLQFYCILHQMEESLEIPPNINVQCIESPLIKTISSSLQGIIPLGECTIEAVRDNGQPYAFSVESSEITVSYLYSYHRHLLLVKNFNL